MQISLTKILPVLACPRILKKKDNNAKAPGEHGFRPGTLFTNRNKE
jgi:hypothetical protein